MARVWRPVLHQPTDQPLTDPCESNVENPKNVEDQERGRRTIGGNVMKYALGGLLLAGGLALSIGTAKADPLTLTSPQI